tara:strand:+ start:321 stop:536 length:216 start_codon:yes stop_codon:yes gene_type:complete
MAFFVLVFSLWGNTGTTWEYIGNQYIYNTPMTLEQCQFIAAAQHWSKIENNEYYRLSVECIPMNKGVGATL